MEELEILLSRISLDDDDHTLCDLLSALSVFEYVTLEMFEKAPEWCRPRLCTKMSKSDQLRIVFPEAWSSVYTGWCYFMCYKYIYGEFPKDLQLLTLVNDFSDQGFNMPELNFEDGHLEFFRQWSSADPQNRFVDMMFHRYWICRLGAHIDVNSIDNMNLLVSQTSRLFFMPPHDVNIMPIIAGGAVLYACCKKDGLTLDANQDFLNGDVDYWFCNRKDGEDVENIMNYFKPPCPCPQNVSVRACTMRFVLHEDEKEERHVNVVVTESSKKHVVNAFDLDCVKAYFDGTTIWATYPFVKCIIERRSNLSPNSKRNKHITYRDQVRVDKYRRRGFLPPEGWPDLDTSCFDHVTVPKMDDSADVDESTERTHLHPLQINFRDYPYRRSGEELTALACHVTYVPDFCFPETPLRKILFTVCLYDVEGTIDFTIAKHSMVSSNNRNLYLPRERKIRMFFNLKPDVYDKLVELFNQVYVGKSKMLSGGGIRLRIPASLIPHVEDDKRRLRSDRVRCNVSFEIIQVKPHFILPIFRHIRCQVIEDESAPSSKKMRK